MSLKYLNNFNPKFINNYFKYKLSFLFDKDDKNLDDKLYFIYKDYLYYKSKYDDITYKYFKGLFYCLNYIKAYINFKHERYTESEILNFKNLEYDIIKMLKKRYNKPIRKNLMKFIIITYMKVNECYNNFY